MNDNFEVWSQGVKWSADIFPDPRLMSGIRIGGRKDTRSLSAAHTTSSDFGKKFIVGNEDIRETYTKWLINKSFNLIDKLTFLHLETHIRH